MQLDEYLNLLKQIAKTDEDAFIQGDLDDFTEFKKVNIQQLKA